MYSLQLSNCRGFDQSEFAAAAASAASGFSSVRRSSVVIRSSFWGGGLGLCDAEARARRRRILSRRSARVLVAPRSELKMNLNEYTVTLEKPLGIRFALSVDGKVFVHALQKGGNAEKSRIIIVGDTLKKASGPSDGKLVEIKDFGDAESLTKEKSGACSLVLERPFAPFPIHQLHLMDDIDILFNRGCVPISTWNKSLQSSNMEESGESSGNSSFVVFCPKFLTSRGWKYLNDQDKNGQPKVARNPPTLPFSPLVAIFTEEASINAEWGHGSFPLEEYVKALDRSKGELYYNHCLGMRYSKITEQLYVGSCIQSKDDVETLSTTAGVTAVLNFQITAEAANWGINSNSVNESCQNSNIVMINYPIRDADSFDLRKKLPFCVGLLLRLLKKNHRVYVTCTSGLDRLPACVIAYLHWMTDTSLHAAYNFVIGLHSCRPDRPAIAWATWDLIAMAENGRHDGPSTHAVTFVWNGHEGEVYMVGDFTGNRKEPIKAVHKGGTRYEADVRLPQGKCHGVSEGVQINRINCLHPHIKEDFMQSRVVIRSDLRNGYNKYFDFAVIGSGVAGLRYALEVAKLGTVAIITKAEPHESNTNYAQGGVSAVLCPSDSVESHVRDTIVAGAYLCDEETVRVVCTEGPERIKELIAMGASFDHGEDGNLHLAREGGHSHRRIVHAADMTGREIERALLAAVRKDPNIFVFEHHFAIDLLTSQYGSDTVCHGVDTLNTETQEVVRFISKVTLLASGGAGHIYPNTTNPEVATGDGIAMAHRADAVISNMEFVQFHPTALADEGLPVKPKEARQNAFLITEAVRGDGGILYNLGMEKFMPMYDERAELAPRDVVARSIDDQLKKRHEKYVLLDISHKPREKILSHFPNIAAECLKHGLDITRQPIPVVPAAHYMCGGVRAGLQGETNVKGLYVAGEVACTGLHGANRLASNSLLEALVFARRAVQPSIDHMTSSRTDRVASHSWARPKIPKSLGKLVLSNISRKTRVVRRELQSIMWEYVGIVRSMTRLQEAENRIGELELEWETYLFQHGWEPTMVGLEACEMRNLFCCAKLVVSSALARHESRGLHYMVDFPHIEESLRLPTIIFPSSPVSSSWSSRQLHRQQI